MKNIIAILLAAVSLTGAQAVESIDPKEDNPEVTQEQKRYITGLDFTPHEAQALRFFQEQGITDKMALAVILGNIKQESKFNPDICEGGARVSYGSCYHGGYGLIQWTSPHRYRGLGNYAKTTSGDPSSLLTQLGYLVTEREWKLACKKFVTPNKSMSFYMNGAYTWLGWGIEGSRSQYSQNYYDRLS